MAIIEEALAYEEDELDDVRDSRMFRRKKLHAKSMYKSEASLPKTKQNSPQSTRNSPQPKTREASKRDAAGPQRSRSESVDVLWVKKRIALIDRAWWKMEQRELDALRQKSHHKKTISATLTSPASKKVSPRKRAVVSPFLVRKASISTNQKMRISGALVTSVTPRSNPKSSDDTKENVTTNIPKSSTTTSSAYEKFPVRQRARSSAFSAAGGTIRAQKEASAATWRDLKQVDRMYRNKLVKNHARNKTMSNSAKSTSQRQLYRNVSARRTLDHSTYSSGRVVDFSRESDTLSSDFGGHGQYHSRDLDRVRRLHFWKEIVVPEWSTVATAPLVRWMWDRHGVPSSMRKHVWPLALGCGERSTDESFAICLKKEQELHATGDFKAGAKTSEEIMGALSFGIARRDSIRQDLARMSALDPSGTRDASAASKAKNLRGQINEILNAFCQARPSVTYVQGMSYLALVLVHHMEQSKAFDCLCNLLDCDYFHHYLYTDAEHIRIRFTIFDELMAVNLPRLHRHFLQMGLLPDCYLMDWLMCLHSRQLSIRAASRVWDGYLIHGEVYVLRISIAILSLLQPKLLSKSLNYCIRILRSKFVSIKEDSLVEAARLVRIPPYLTARMIEAGISVVAETSKMLFK
eukprot:CAMPEP_0184480508 /NCGR_PEP_ID=MMETSP0113_2-20130426/2024_1 /TAXON_ID=91329 /ORGANISM="Norrisiella sphaerica, Strain BC52" /LENGTH=634 /DNA_ID=CAMNT_0026859047 /DNA_START=378 /DNA_END=2282 /DNA_ORIENTATION=+